MINFVVPGIATSVQCLTSPINNEALAASASDSNLANISAESSLASSQAFSILGGLNPELYKPTYSLEPGEEEFYPDYHRGRVWFKLFYEPQNEQLVIHLIKVKNLPSRVKGSVNCCDPFVRIQLLPEERRYVQSKIKKKTCNPKFDETFVFQVPARAVNERSIRITVFDNERGKKHNVIGHIIVQLKEIGDNLGENTLLWRDLETEIDE
ncbi:synaptotagmin-15-like protein, partial [Dinothrombium tinctorium]